MWGSRGGVCGGGGSESRLVQGIFSKEMQQDLLPLTRESKLQEGRPHVLFTAETLVPDIQ